MIAGTGAAAWLHATVWWKALLALAVALALIVGVNFANDYSDGIRGTDDNRAGPLRLVGSRLATPRAVLTVALASLAVGAVAKSQGTIEDERWQESARGLARHLDEAGYADSFGISR